MTRWGEPRKWLEEHLNFSPDECLIWPFARCQRTIEQPAYRAMLRLTKGDPPTPKHEAAHSCGNGHLGCINPKHLRWATHLENEADKIAHGTVAHGERNGHAKLTQDQVLYIRTASGLQKDIAAKFGIDQSMVSFIKRRRNWAHLKDE